MAAVDLPTPLDALGTVRVCVVGRLLPLAVDAGLRRTFAAWTADALRWRAFSSCAYTAAHSMQKTSARSRNARPFSKSSSDNRLPH
jgi:hypothetical protein